MSWLLDIFEVIGMTLYMLFIWVLTILLVILVVFLYVLSVLFSIPKKVKSYFGDKDADTSV